MFQCKRCDKEFRDGVQCTLCLNYYDFPCSGITETGFRKLGDRKSTWRCSTCKSTSASASPTPPRNPEMETILHELKYVSAQISTMPALVESISSLSSRMERIEEEVQSLRSAKEAISSLEQRVTQFETKMNDEEQRSRLNNIEIKGVPVTVSENLYDHIYKIREIIKCKIAKDQINYIMRVPTRGDNAKNIIVSLHNRYLKEDFVAAARSSKRFTASNLGLARDKRIYINDHLTLHNKNLLNKTKILAKEKGFPFTYIQTV